jgi:hypothetical protein
MWNDGARGWGKGLLRARLRDERLGRQCSIRKYFIFDSRRGERKRDSPSTERIGQTFGVSMRSISLNVSAISPGDLQCRILRTPELLGWNLMDGHACRRIFVI